MQGLTEAVDYQQGKISARKTRLAITFNNNDTNRIRPKTGLSQMIFASSFGGFQKTVEAWENGRNKPKVAPRYRLGIIRDDHNFLKWFQAIDKILLIN